MIWYDEAKASKYLFLLSFIRFVRDAGGREDEIEAASDSTICFGSIQVFFVFVFVVFPIVDRLINVFAFRPIDLWSMCADLDIFILI